MRSVLTCTLLALLGSIISPAATLYDTFNQPQTNCNYNFGPTFSSCDVVGSPADFDIEKANVTVTGSTINVTLFFNYGGGITLAPFNDGLSLQVGDLFFYDPADPKTTAYDPSNPYPEYKYGVPLHAHNGLTAGNLYLISDYDALQTADSLLHDNGHYYRRTEPVLMPSGEALASTGNGVSVVNNGNGVTAAKYAATIQIPTTAGFLSLINNGQLGIGFSSADCGNDVILGTVNVGSQVPEPGTWGMFAAGLGLVAVGVRRRRSAPKDTDKK